MWKPAHRPGWPPKVGVIGALKDSGAVHLSLLSFGGKKTPSMHRQHVQWCVGTLRLQLVAVRPALSAGSGGDTQWASREGNGGLEGRQNRA